MKVVVFGCGPMPCEPEFAVTAPGARTWQMVQTVVNGLILADVPDPQVLVIALDSVRRDTANAPLSFDLALDAALLHETEAPATVQFTYLPLSIEGFKLMGQGKWPEILNDTPDAIVATGSAQPYATAALYARHVARPLWVDVFGDPLAELQSRAELFPERKEENDSFYYHTWKLLMEALMQGDIFSTLSTRQRFSLIGHLGVAGRLNRSTRCYEFVHPIPYGVFPASAPQMPEPHDHAFFVVMWCGSFNTWMDVDTLALGIVKAWQKNRRLRLLIAGGACPGYNERSFQRFSELIRRENASEAIRLVDWQPYGELNKLYAEADVGLSIDRPTYEAMLGSRTRLIHFLLAGKPVISTTPTELAEDLERAGVLLPFRMGDPDHLAEVLLAAGERSAELCELGRRGREYVLTRYHGRIIGAALIEWLANPTYAPDKRGPHSTLDPGNPLANYWQHSLDNVRTF
ncbi:MAG: glycosyltransferase [Candidatus Sumerlaeaceae bacterium]